MAVLTIARVNYHNIYSILIARRKPGPKPRRVIQSPSPLSSSSIPGAPSASLNQLFAAADSPRPPSRNDDSDNIGTAPSTTSTPTSSSSTASQSQNHKDGRPRNLGRGVSKPKKNTVASLLAQSRALGIKPVQIDPNTPMNQQISMLKSNMLAAQFMAESGDDKLLVRQKLLKQFKYMYVYNMFELLAGEISWRSE